MNDLPPWLEGARGAPSAHNTQPWRFTPLADGRVAVRWDERRSLPVGDPTHRDLYLGLGAAVESACLRVAMAGETLRFEPAGEDQDHVVGHLVPDGEAARPDDAALAALLATRHTARGPHLRQPVPAEVIAGMRAEATRGGCGFHVAADRLRIRRLGALGRRATAELYADAPVHSELFRWLRLDPSDPAHRRDGLTAGCLELRGVALRIAQLIMPPAHMRRLVRCGLHHVLAVDTALTVRRSATLCLLTAPSVGRTDLVRAGRTLLRLWLLAERAGLSTHPVSALLDVAATAGPTLEVFGAAGETAANVFRLGACPPAERSPRLPAAELVDATP